MIYQTACYTDQGEFRPSNQDSCCVKIAQMGGEQVALALMCDGLGGLVQGELASAEVVRAFDSWFWNYLPELLREGLDESRLSAQWNGLIQGANRAIRSYGMDHGITLGTTVTAFLAVGERYFLLHAGDCRAYLLYSGQTLQLTMDQTLAAREYQAGHISAAQLRADERQHVLLQCVGVSQVTPDFLSGQLPGECTVLLCSDGFYHTLAPGELAGLSAPPLKGAAVQLELERLGALCRQRGEQDNLTAAALLCLPSVCPPTASMEGGGESEFRVLLDLTQIHTQQTI